MQVSLESTSALERKMTVVVPAEEITTALQQRLQKMSQQVKVSGFRPGKVPLNVVKQRFGKQVLQEVVSDTIRSSYPRAIDQKKLQPAGAPHIEPLQIETNEDLKYVAIFEVYPEVDLADVSQFRIELAQVDITASDVDNMLEKIRWQKARWNEVSRASKTDDRAVLDLKCMVDGELFPGGSWNDGAIVVGGDSPLPELGEHLYDVKKDQEKSFTATFPKDFFQPDLAGKVATFEIKVKKVEEGELPELDEAFVKDFGIEEGGLDTLKEQLEKNMSEELEHQKKAFIQEQVMQNLFVANEFDLPNSLVQQEIKALRTRSMMETGIKDESAFPDTLFEEKAKKAISLGLIIDKIATQNAIQLDQEKVNERLGTIASGYTNPEEMIQYYRNNAQAMLSIETPVLEGQVVDWVLEQAQQTSKLFTFDEFVNKRAQNF